MRLDNSGVESEAERADTLGQWAPVAFVYLLWISIFSIAQMLLTNTVEEKSNKLVEVLLSSVAPVELMAGKILGIAATGLTIVASWLTLLLAAVLWLPGLLGGSGSVDSVGPDQRPDVSRVVHRLFRTRLSVLRGVAVRNRVAREQPERGADADDADPAAADRAAAS